MDHESELWALDVLKLIDHARSEDRGEFTHSVYVTLRDALEDRIRLPIKPGKACGDHRRQGLIRMSKREGQDALC
jgi:hypothetical protein